MGGKFYRIIGLSEEMLSKHREELKDEILIVNDEMCDGKTKAIVRLYWWEALIMRIRMRLYNSSHEACFKLVKD